MKKIMIICQIVSLLSTASCSKPQYNDLGGNLTLNGIVMLYDTLSGPYAYRSLPGVTVYIRDSTDTANYLYSTKSDMLGQFSFNGFDAAKQYVIYAGLDSAQEIYSGNLVYHATGGSFLTNRDTLALSPDSGSQNGIFCEVFDMNGGRMANAQVYVFNSSILAGLSDTAAANYKLRSDNFGRGLRLNVGYGKYSLQGFYYDTISKIKFTGSASVTVGNTGIRTVPLTLFQIP